MLSASGSLKLLKSSIQFVQSSGNTQRFVPDFGGQNEALDAIEELDRGERVRGRPLFNVDAVQLDGFGQEASELDRQALEIKRLFRKAKLNGDPRGQFTEEIGAILDRYEGHKIATGQIGAQMGRDACNSGGRF